MPHTIFDTENRLLMQARQGDRLTTIWLIIPLSLLFIIISQSVR